MIGSAATAFGPPLRPGVTARASRVTDIGMTPLLLGAWAERTRAGNGAEQRRQASKRPPGHPARGRCIDVAAGLLARGSRSRPAFPKPLGFSDTRVDKNSPLTVAGAAPDWPETGAPGSLLAQGRTGPENQRRPYLVGDSIRARNRSWRLSGGCTANQQQIHNTMLGPTVCHGGKTDSIALPTRSGCPFGHVPPPSKGACAQEARHRD